MCETVLERAGKSITACIWLQKWELPRGYEGMHQLISDNLWWLSRSLWGQEHIWTLRVFLTLRINACSWFGLPHCLWVNSEFGVGAIGGGGRYDGLVELEGGRPNSGVGFAVGFERIMLALERLLVQLSLRLQAVCMLLVQKTLSELLLYWYRGGICAEAGIRCELIALVVRWEGTV